MDTSETTVVPLFNAPSEWLTITEFLQELEEQGLPLPQKQIEFRRKSGTVNGHDILPELNFRRVRGFGSRPVIGKQEAIRYIQRLKKQSVNITYKDVKSVVESYDEVMLKPARAAMRANRGIWAGLKSEVLCQRRTSLIYEKAIEE